MYQVCSLTGSCDTFVGRLVHVTSLKQTGSCDKFVGRLVHVSGL